MEIHSDVIGQTLDTSGGWKIKVVTELPTRGRKGIIYLVPISKEANEDKYQEFIWVNNAWERYGDESAAEALIEEALKNYYNKGEVDTQHEAINTRIGSAESAIDTEKTERQTADSGLSTRLSTEEQATSTHRNNSDIHFSDAPADGKQYIRKNKQWVEGSGAGDADEVSYTQKDEHTEGSVGEEIGDDVKITANALVALRYYIDSLLYGTTSKGKLITSKDVSNSLTNASTLVPLSALQGLKLNNNALVDEAILANALIQLSKMIDPESLAAPYYAYIQYKVGDVVEHQGSLYRCNTSLSQAEFFDPTHWTKVRAMSYIKILSNSLAPAYDATKAYTEGDVVSHDCKLYELTNNIATYSGLDEMNMYASAYDSTKSYSVGDACSHDHILYRCVSATEGTEETPEDWDETKWSAIKYDATATYSVGDIVLYDGTLWKCNTAITAAEEFDSSKWTAKWQQTTLIDQIKKQ